MSDDLASRLDRLVDIQHELESILQTLVLNDSTIIDALAQMLGAIQQMNARAIDTQIRTAEAQEKLTAEIGNLAAAIVALGKDGDSVRYAGASNSEAGT